MFDVDGTLIDYAGKPRYDVINLFRSLEAFGCEMFICSGGGKPYAEAIRDKLGLNAQCSSKLMKKDPEFDLTVDDEHITLGAVNLKV